MANKKEPAQKQLKSFLKVDNVNVPTPEVQLISKLNPGVYSLEVTREGELRFIEINHNSDAIIDLPDPVYAQVVSDLEAFLSPETRKRFEEKGYVYKRSSLLYGKPGCHAKGTKILMFNGAVKNVEDVVVGDLLMGPDSCPRKVLELARGREPMVRIMPTKGDAFTVNVNHILHLTPSGESVASNLKSINIKFSDLIQATECFQERMKLTRTGVEFSGRNDLPIPPYILGLWLGDGTSSRPEITTADTEIKESLDSYAKSVGMELIARGSKTSGKADTYYISGSLNGGKKKNPVTEALRELEVLDNKHIPQIYKTASREHRLEMLAGLIDSDGSLSCNGYDFISRSKVLADDVAFVSRSLGLAAYVTGCTKTCANNGVSGNYYRVFISGDCMEVPVRLERKRASERQQIKNVLRSGFTYEILPEDDYYGFALNGDHLYLTADFTIHHNTGKTCLINRIANKVIANGGTVLFNPNPAYLQAAFMALDSIQPDTMLMVVFEELDELLKIHEGALLNALDGEIQKNNVIYMATTNYIDKIPARIRRPGRFSSTMEVKFPSPQARQVYLAGKLTLTKEEMEKWLQLTDGFSIDELSETVRAVYCLQQTLESVTKRITSSKSDSVPEDTHTAYDSMERFQDALIRAYGRDDSGDGDW